MKPNAWCSVFFLAHVGKLRLQAMERTGLGPRGNRIGTEGRVFWAKHRASWGLSFLLGDTESLPQALPRGSGENVPPATTRRQDCGLFILGMSCRHSSTFFHCRGCPSPTHFPGLGERGVLFQPAMPCLSPLVSLHQAVFTSLSVSFKLSVSLPICLSPSGLSVSVSLCLSLSLSDSVSAGPCISLSLSHRS